MRYSAGLGRLFSLRDKEYGISGFGIRDAARMNHNLAGEMAL